MTEHHFQTHPAVADFMVGLLPKTPQLVLEPTPGAGRLSDALSRAGHQVVTPHPARSDFWKMEHDQLRLRGCMKDRYDYVVMNPPFTPMIQGWHFLTRCIELSDQLVCLLPWMLLLNSQKRLNILVDFGLISVANLPRKAFPDSRVQCCVLHLRKGWNKPTELTFFNFE